MVRSWAPQGAGHPYRIHFLREMYGVRDDMDGTTTSDTARDRLALAEVDDGSLNPAT